MRQAERETGRADLDESLRRILSTAPHTIPVRVRPRTKSLWDPPLEIDPYWSPTAILGFRAWEVRGLLQGARRAWSTPRYEAGCVHRGEERFDHSVPHTDGSCGRPPCGIYATKDPEPLLNEFSSHRMAYGLVELSGKVVEHDHGYRAKRATAVFVAVVDQGRLITVEGSEDLDRLFADPERYLEGRLASDPHHSGPLRPEPVPAIVRAMRKAAAERANGVR